MERNRLIKNHCTRVRDLLKNVRVIYSDLDNTLLGPRGSIFMTSDHKFSIKPILSLLKLIEADIDVVLVSGRNLNQLREIARLLSIDNFISELGCLIFYDQGKEVLQNYDFATPKGRTLHEAVTDSGAPSLLLTHFKDHLEYHTPWSNKQTCTHLFRGLIDVEEANDLLSGSGFGGLRIIDNGSSQAKTKIPNVSEVRIYHLLPAGTSKASAIRKDQAKRKIKPTETIALGDSLADLEMAEAVNAFFMVADNIAEKTQLSAKLLSYDNTYLTTKKMGLGWAEVADLIIPE